MTAAALLTSDFATLPDLIRAHAQERGDKVALVEAGGEIDYAALDALIDRIAAALQRDGVRQGDAVAIVGAASIDYAAVFLGALRAGCVATPIAPSSTAAAIVALIEDCAAPITFIDTDSATALAGHRIPGKLVHLKSFGHWIAPDGARPQPVEIAPQDSFNIIYSSGTTGTPKGIVQSHAMRWAHISRNEAANFANAVTIIATPLYSNTTLVSFLPTLGWGGTVVLMKKFDARGFLQLAERRRATHTMLVPVQYNRIMALADFDRYDLSSFVFKTSTSAPFSAALKAEVVARWPGLLVEYYGMTEGGGTCLLVANAHPDKLHTVGRAVDGHDIRLIDDDGKEVPAGATGEVVGRSPAMMTGYHARAEATDAALWFDAQGNRFIRHGDVGLFDDDGFLTLLDRKKDLIISGGFNIYPTDLEAVLSQHPAVAECSVIGIASETWGETPVGFYVPHTGVDASIEDILDWTNAQLGKTQRLSALHAIAELPRSTIGKVLKRDLRDQLSA